MRELLLVGCGGFVGSVLRYLCILACAASNFSTSSGLLFVNCFGSLLAGALMALSLSDEFKLLLIIGVLGGFTTFSSFSVMIVEALSTQKVLLVAFTAMLHLFACISLAAAGFYIGLRLK